MKKKEFTGGKIIVSDTKIEDESKRSSIMLFPADFGMLFAGTREFFEGNYFIEGIENMEINRIIVSAMRKVYFLF